MPIKSYLSEIFARSPVRPIQEHMAKVMVCVEKLEPFAEAALAGDWEAAKALRKEISQLEGQADTLKKDLRLTLPVTLLLPVARADLLDLLSRQDKLANKAKDISGLMLGRRMQIPEQLREVFGALVRRTVDGVRQAQKSVKELDELFETGFRGAEVKLVESMIAELGAIESDCDDLQSTLRESLFLLERDLPPVDVVFTYQLIDWVGDLGDMAQRIGGQLHRLIAR